MAGVQDLHSYRPVQDNEISLCRFLDDTDYISAELKNFHIDSLPRYQTISYVWSLGGLTPTRNWTMKINGVQLPILDTLRPFIQTLRTKEILLDGTWWWIDSLCMDLTNIKERSLQVQVMRRVYRDCHRCTVWLGEESENSERAVNFIQLLHRIDEEGHSIKEIRQIMQEQDHQASWALLEEFFMRKWWTRVWTLQEFVLPSMVSFWCGSRTISRTAVCAALLIADKCDSMGFKDSIAFRQGWNRRRVWRWHKMLSEAPEVHAGLSLPALAAYFCTNEATNDIDRLYGIHGLSAIDRDLLEIDYSQSADQIYFRFTKSFIEKHGSLDLTMFASIFPSSTTSSLPSWVPDWRQAPLSGPLVLPLMVSQSGNINIGNIRPTATLDSTTPPVCYNASRGRPAMYVFENSTLCVRGIVIDYLAGSETCAGYQEPGSKITMGPPTAHAQCSVEKFLISICRSLVLDRHDRYLRFPVPTEEFFKDFLGLCALAISDPTAVESEFLEWFNQTRHFQIHDVLSLEAMVLQHLEQTVTALPSSAPNQEQYIQNSFYGRFYDTVVRMSLHLTVTRNGRVGMVSEKVREDDLVCIPYGCSVPVVLRKVGKDAYTLVGECFIDQCMTGEALESDYPEITFRIH